MDLDPNFVRLANERLWTAHPELGRRQLTGGAADAPLRAEWMGHYRDAASATPESPAATPAAATPPPAPGPVLACADCTEPRRWLCVRSNVAGGKESLTAGHANLSLHEGASLATSTATTYGSWPDDHPAIAGAGLSNAAGSDIRVNFAGDNPSGYRYVHCREITPAQYSRFQADIANGHQWGYTNNCSSFASETFYDVIGIDADADEDIWGLETPRELGANIIDLNGGVPSNFESPAIPPAPGPSSSSGG